MRGDFDAVGHTAESHKTSNINGIPQYFHPPRPPRLRPRARMPLSPRLIGGPNGRSSGSNPDYVNWLTEQSMLADADAFAKQFSGQGSMWQNPFANPDPRAAIEKASVWFTAYPISMITKPGSSFLGTLGDEDLWEAFEQIGIDGRAHRPGEEGRRHRRLGGDARASTGTSTGSAPRSTRRSAPRRSSGRCARWPPAHGGIVIDDIVPGHTGKGADFRLAEMKVGDYPGIYHMVEIPTPGLAPAARRSPRARTRSTSTPRPRTGWPRPATSSAGCSG